MRITIWGINYHPEQVGIGVYNTDLCEWLTGAGHHIVMVTAFAYYPAWRQSDQDKFCLYRSEMVGKKDDGQRVRVHRCWLYVPDKPNAVRRMVHEATFTISSFCKLLTLDAPDLYLVVMPPLLLGVAAWFLSIFKRVPVQLHVQDLQPDAALSLGMLREGQLASFLRMLEKFAYARAAQISTISPEMGEIIQNKGISPDKIVLFPNWVSLPDVSTRSQGQSWKVRHGVAPQTAVISYAGNLGVKQGLEIIGEAAALLQNENLLFVIAGNGGMKIQLQDLVSESRLSNVFFQDVLSDEEHTDLILESEICLIPQKKGSSSHFLPSKLLKILALGRPVITNADPGSALYNAVKAGEFGCNVTPGDVKALVESIVKLLAEPSWRTKMGNAGQKFVRQFDRDTVLSKAVCDFEKICVRESEE
jgi:colanic acid biosynthesis glycosyl transferase WcaI